MSRHLLPLSILALAAAVAFHAVAPAHASDLAGMQPKCVVLKTFRVDDFTAALQGLYAEGARDFTSVSSNTLCGWH